MRPEEQIQNNDPNQLNEEGQELANSLQTQAFTGGQNAVETYQTQIQSPEPPQIELPKGGGALRSIGEKFEANPVTGTANISVPIAISPGRNNFQPQLSLSYSSGGGNGIFGMGWSIGIPSIKRKTQKGLPTYDDEKDVFLFAGVEDLVPIPDSQKGKYENSAQTHQIQRYRPRIEGSFLKIEKWEDNTSHEVHWRVTDKNNVVSVFGESKTSRIYDSENEQRIYEWKIQYKYDALGNYMQYEYIRENATGVDSLPSEYNRLANSSALNQLYLRRIKYGYQQMYPDAGWDPENNAPHFELIFNYGEDNSSYPGAFNRVEQYPDPQEENELYESIAWTKRQDPFSTFRAGFDLRTYRLCRSIQMFHHFSGLNGGDPLLVKTTELSYDEKPSGTQLSSVVHKGHDESNTESLPPVSFSYTQAEVSTSIQTLKEEDAENLPAGIDNQNYRWADPNGEGIQGILTESANAWYFKPNYGHDNFYEDHPVTYTPEPLVSLGKLTTLKQKPNGAAAASLQDIDGDGLQEAVVRAPGMNGFYKQDQEGEWNHFQHFDTHPNLNLQSEDVKFVDLNGDGRADILITEQDRIEWIPYADQDVLAHPEDRKVKAGYQKRRGTSNPLDEEEGPRLVFSNGRQNIFLSDMSGDGFSDLVRINNGSIDYWPHLGYGRFGAKVSLGNVPTFDYPDQFDARRIRLGDIDGSGTTDIIYLGRKEATYFLNQSGNALADGVLIPQLPKVDNMQNVQLVDILGNGTSCLVWSSPHEKDKPFHIKYIDLMGGQKPYLLEEMDNGMGALRKFSYAPSTKFYLRDQRAGKPWVTKLPFPVQCLERVEIFEQVTQSRYVSRYAYHHGYFDPIEREFRGFGMVEQWDTELYEDFTEAALYQVGSNALDEESHSAPVYTKSWFHNGYYSQKNKIEAQYATEYWDGDNQAFPPLALDLPANLKASELRQAYRALKGSLLRQEVYGLDESGNATTPYSVVENFYRVVKEQDIENNRFASFRKETVDSRTYAYEQDATDPRISQQLLLESDEYGFPFRTATIAYGRRSGVEQEQTKTHIIINNSSVVNLADTISNGVQTDSNHRLGVVFQEQLFEMNFSSTSGLQTAAPLLAEFLAAPNIDPDDSFSGSVTERRIVSAKMRWFYNEEATSSLPFAAVSSHALPYISRELAFSDNLINSIYNDGISRIADIDSTMGSIGYIKSGSLWYKPSSRMEYDADNFYLPTKVIDQFSNETNLNFDDYFLFLEKVTDPLGNEVQATNNYIHLQPTLQTDPNGNRQQVILDALGMPLKVLVMGKDSSHPDYIKDEGDTEAEPSQAFTYDRSAFYDHGAPASVAVVIRDTHYLESNNNDEWRKTVTYYDGLGNPIQQRNQFKDWAGTNGEETPVAVSGRQIKNNKGLVVEQYEPYEEEGFDYVAASDDTIMARIKLQYDVLGRNIRIDYDDGTFEKVEFTAWEQKNYDRNDNTLASDWYANNNSPDPLGNEPNDPDERAAYLSAKHDNTPQILHLDSLGRMFLRKDDLGSSYLDTRFEYDLLGRRTKTTDPRGLITNYAYDLTAPGKEDGASSGAEREPMVLFNDSPDAGKRYALFDVAHKPSRRWNSRKFTYRHEYDALQRPTEHWVKPDGGTEYLAEIYAYGEGAGAANNMRGRLIQSRDQAGRVAVSAYDFKGNLLNQFRQFASVYDTVIDHNGSFSFESEFFAESWEYDALNRLTEYTSADDTKRNYGYNHFGLLHSVKINARGSSTQEDAIDIIRYNGRGQRTRVFYANGTVNKINYDNKTFRILRSFTERDQGSGVENVQDLTYYYDANGNIIEIQDAAQETVFFNNAQVDPTCQYEYDALDRLAKAKGRQLVGLNNAPSHNDISIKNPVPDTDTAALENYTRTYQYDANGNITQMQNVAGSSWTKNFYYESTNNRLDRHSDLGSSEYSYDEHGNITSMSHLSSMQWDYNDRLIEADLTGGGMAYYRYDSGGNRVRKIVIKDNVKKERLYLGELEIYKKGSSGTVDLIRESIFVTDDRKRFLQIDSLTKENGIGIDDVNVVNEWRYQYDNHLNSACLELDANGDVISYEEYFPYGGSSYRSGKSEAEVKRKRFRYTGKERDEETGLYNYGARYYAPWLCRFISCDPLGMVDAPSLYAYVRNNPIKLTDPDGMQAGGEDEEEKQPFLDEQGKITEAGKKELSNYSKDVVKAVEKFSGLVQEYIEENEGASIDEAIDQINSFTRDDEWVYVQEKRNANNTERPYVAYHAGLVYKTLNYIEQEAELVTEPVQLLSNPTSNKYLEDFYSVPDQSSIKGLRVYNRADSMEMVSDIRINNLFTVRDSTIAPNDSMDIMIDFITDRVVGVSTDINPNDSSSIVGKPTYSVLREKPKGPSGKRIAPMMFSGSKISFTEMQKYFLPQ